MLEKYKKNLHLEGSKVMSYDTHVATINHSEGTLTIHGFWSNTTSMHVNYVAEQYKLKKLKDNAKEEREKENEEKSAKSMMGFMNMFSVMAGMGKDTKEEKLEAEASIIFRTPGIIKPEDWDKLSFEEKEKRMNGVKKIMKTT